MIALNLKLSRLNSRQPSRTRSIFCLLIITTMQSSCLDSYWVKLSGALTIGDQWTELQAKTPLKADKTFQYVVLELEPPFKDDWLKEGRGPDKGLGILMPDGEVVNPEIEVIDQDGNSFKLVYGGSTGGFGSGQAPEYCYPYPKDLPRDHLYKTVRIRSRRSIKVKAVYWFCESSKDWP